MRCQSCTTTMAAMVMDSKTARGAAVCSGIRSASRGTATRASPNPKAERITVAMKMTSSTATVAMADPRALSRGGSHRFTADLGGARLRKGRCAHQRAATFEDDMHRSLRAYLDQ